VHAPPPHTHTHTLAVSCRKEPVGPIEWLRQNEIEVRVTRTKVKPYMYFAYTDPKMDDDESAHLHNSQMIEGTITSVSARSVRWA
jgi:hypothetical protein